MPPELITKTIRTTLETGINNEKPFIAGYAAKWDNPDIIKDSFSKGAFVDSEQDLTDGKILLRTEHRVLDKSIYKNIGVIKEFESDENGFKIKADIFNTDDAKKAYEMVKGAPNGFGLSTSGYLKKLGKNKWGGKDIQKVKLTEVTLSDAPADHDTMGLIAADETSKLRLSKLNRNKTIREVILKQRS